MFAKIESPKWLELYTIWRYSCQNLNSSIISSPNIIEIKVDSPGWDWHHNEYIDWWSNEDFNSKEEAIELYGVSSLNSWGKTKAGTRTTADLLWNLRDDPEGMALVWIGASMWDKLKTLPDGWRGATFRHVQLLFNETIKQLRARNVFTWYHSSRDALPITIHDNWILDEALVPTNYEQLIAIATIESILTYSNWTIVRLVASNE